jgi:hypothetical protein
MMNDDENLIDAKGMKQKHSLEKLMLSTDNDLKGRTARVKNLIKQQMK